MIMAAGLGTRMKSRKTKVLHEVAGRPLIAWAVETAKEAGAGKIVAILGHQLEDVKDALDKRYGENEIVIAHQKEQNGTGHAVRCALEAITDEPDDKIVVILSGDAPLLKPQRVKALIEAATQSKSHMALLSTSPAVRMPYGRLIRDDDGNLKKIIEDADATEKQKEINELNAGFYAIRLGELRQSIGGIDSNNAQGEIYLTDLAEIAYKNGGAEVLDVPFEETSGINNRVDLANVSKVAQKRIVESHMTRGVTFQDPAQTYVDADIKDIGSDTFIAAGVQLRGNIKIGTGVFIDTGCVLTNVEIGDDIHLKPYSVLSDSKVGNESVIGPFTHCRPGTVVEENVKLGNFVETKKAHFKNGSKASHLSYLGDASIGSKANIGCGTITCNYDGFKKHKTVIESGAFIGSDSQLVAPVTIGRDAFVGSGTTVTKDVPRSSLALSRSKQVNVDGWADRFREAQEKRKK